MFAVNVVSISFAKTMLKTREALIDVWAEGWSDAAEVNNEMKYAVDPEDTEEIEHYLAMLSDAEEHLNLLSDEIDRLQAFMTMQGILMGMDQGWARQ